MSTKIAWCIKMHPWDSMIFFAIFYILPFLCILGSVLLWQVQKFLRSFENGFMQQDPKSIQLICFDLSICEDYLCGVYVYILVCEYVRTMMLFTTTTSYAAITFPRIFPHHQQEKIIVIVDEHMRMLQSKTGVYIFTSFSKKPKWN